MAVDLTAAQQFIDSSPEIQAILSDPRMDYRAKMYRINAIMGQHGFKASIDFKTGKAIEVSGDLPSKETLAMWATLASLGLGPGGGAGAFTSGGGVLPSTPVGTGAVTGLESFTPVAGVLPSATIGTGAVTGLKDFTPVGNTPTDGGIPPVSPPTGDKKSSILDLLLKIGVPVGLGLVGKHASGGFGGDGNGPGGQMSPELSELLALSMQRMRDQEPLFQAVTKQALAGLPTYAKNGGANDYSPTTTYPRRPGR